LRGTAAFLESGRRTKEARRAIPLGLSASAKARGVKAVLRRQGVHSGGFEERFFAGMTRTAKG
jgi:hypothetical protein